MNDLIAHAQAHPLLVGLAVLAALAVAAYEWREARHSAGSVSPQEAVMLINRGALVVDIRSNEDFEAGHISGARRVPSDQIVTGATAIERFKEKTIVTYCESGVTAAAAARQLIRHGFKHPVNLRGGIQAWRAEQLPLVKGP
jgi:rhodanese-related sulfurtransferase